MEPKAECAEVETAVVQGTLKYDDLIILIVIAVLFNKSLTCVKRKCRVEELIILYILIKYLTDRISAKNEFHKTINEIIIDVSV